MKKVSKGAMPELANIYNSQGRQALYRCLRERYGIQSPGSFLQRMKSNPGLAYDAGTDVFTVRNVPTDEVFMSMEELCAGTLPHVQKTPIQHTDKSVEMRNLIQELIGERLLELNRYVKLDARSRTVLIDAASLKNDGYTIVNQ